MLRVVVSGLVGGVLSEFNCECVLEPGKAAFQCHTEEGKERLLSGGLLHLAAAAARTVYLIDSDVGCGTSLKKEAVDEVQHLSLTYSIPTPFTQLVQAASNIPVVPAQTPHLPLAAGYINRTRTYLPLLLQHQKLLYAYDNGKKPLRPSEPPIAPCLPPSRPPTDDFIREVVLKLLREALQPASVHRLVPLQRRDGAFELTSVFASAVGLTKARLQDAMPESLLHCPTTVGAGCEAEAAVRERWWATAIALAAGKGLGSPLTILMERQAERFLRRSTAAVNNTLNAGDDVSAEREKELQFREWVEAAAELLSKSTKIMG